MQIVVLAGGRGQRLYPLTAHRPRALLPVMGRPLLGQLLRHLAGQDGAGEVIVTTGHLGEMIDRYVACLRLPVPVRTVRAAEAGEGGETAVDGLLSHLRSPFAVVRADTAIDLDLAAMAAVHRRQGAVATVCVAPPRDRAGFRVVEAAAGRVTAFLRQPPLARLVPSAGADTGCYLLERAAVERGGLGKDLLPRLVAGGQVVATAHAARFWAGIGTGDAYREAHLRALTGAWPWPVPQSGRPVLISGRVDLTGPVHFGSNVVIGPGVRLEGPLYIGSDVVIGPGAEVVRSVLLNGCVIGGGCLVHEAVVDAGAILPKAAAAAGGIVSSAPGAARPTLAPARAGERIATHAASD